jgi:malate dehydrogenase (oxaloacetate-decarboxylating)
VILAALTGSMKLSGLSLKDQRVVVFGAGTAGCGISDQICEAMVRDGGMTLAEAKRHFYLIDRQGLIIDSMDDLTDGQKRYARSADEFTHESTKTLIDVVRRVHPTVLIGTSTTPGAFTEEVVREMAAHTERPAIFPISNPTKLAEAKAADVIKWSDGKALVCTGIPSDPVEWKGVSYKIGQGNNALMYPGIGFGAIVAKAKVINKNMLIAAAEAVGDIVDYTQPGAPILPEVGLLKEVSRKVAIAVVRQAVKDHVNGVAIKNPEQAVDDCIWRPEYKEEKVEIGAD